MIIIVIIYNMVKLTNHLSNKAVVSYYTYDNFTLHAHLNHLNRRERVNIGYRTPW